MPVALYAGAGLVLAVVLARKFDVIPGLSDIAYSAGNAAVDTVDAVVSGVVVGAGKVAGIPATNKTQCQHDLARGDMWEASFSCPAKDFLSAAWNQYGF
ncbi:hypothetical protein SAMN05216428_102436 [Nitrosospira sp. Nsp11]|nr:hypothetical protein SAMN05216428_102436 [Nitrosospira sp. Nsp11]